MSPLNKALLETDTLSEISKGVNLTVAANATAYRRAFGRYTISTVSVMEIVRGFQQNQSTRRLQAFVASLATVEILPFDLPDAELAGRIAGDLERVGRQGCFRTRRTVRFSRPAGPRAWSGRGEPGYRSSNTCVGPPRRVVKRTADSRTSSCSATHRQRQHGGSLGAALGCQGVAHVEPDELYHQAERLLAGLVVVVDIEPVITILDRDIRVVWPVVLPCMVHNK
jgi:predicted nucleic acid-binding protein